MAIGKTVAIFNILKTSNMLARNGETIKDLKGEFPKDEKHYHHNQTATFELAPKYYKRDITNGRNLYPSSFSIENFYSVLKDGKSDEYVYFKSQRKDKNGDPVYTPGIISFRKGRIVVPKSELDFFIFLMNHPRRAQSKNNDPNRNAFFYLVNHKQDAIEIANKKQQIAKVTGMIWNDGLPEDTLRTVAKTYQIPSVDALSIEEVKVHLDKKAQANPSIFLESKGLGAEMEIRALIQDARDYKLLIFKKDKSGADWNIVNDHGKAVHLIAVRAGEDEYARLAKWLLHQDESGTIDRIQEMVARKKKKGKKQLV